MGLFDFNAKLKEAEKLFASLKPVIDELKARDLGSDAAQLVFHVDKFEADTKAVEEAIKGNDNPTDDAFLPLLQRVETLTSVFGDDVRAIALRFGVLLQPEGAEPKAFKVEKPAAPEEKGKK